MSPAGRRLAQRWPGASTLAALVAYAGVIHHGIGPTRENAPRAWYAPTGFLRDGEPLAGLLSSTSVALGAIGLPAVLLVSAVFVTCQSAIARALALSALVATLLFGFYGVQAPFVWRFFGWRGSVVMVATGLWVGFAAAAPWLAASWLRRGWGLRLALYLPVWGLAVVLMRNATGTDPSLPFAISPWPAIPVFGIEVGALLVLVVVGGIALGVTGVARARAGGSFPSGPVLLGLGAAAPPLLLLVDARLGSLPFGVGGRTLAVVAAACVLGIALAAWGLRERPEELSRRARTFAVAAALLATPLLSGQALAYRDYVVTRDVRAQRIVDALAAYYAREETYPDKLDALVASGDLDEIPRPRIGSGLFGERAFRYESFGTSYLLEFDAPRWVQCAYSSPWEDEDESAESEASGGGGLAASWSCPAQPPELW